MRRLARWEPLLVGGVAEGWASEHSDVRLELVADDPKSVEIALAGDGVKYAALPPRADDPAAHLRIDSSRAAVRLAILTAQQRRNRPRRDDEVRLDIDELVEVLARDEGTASIAPESWIRMRAELPKGGGLLSSDGDVSRFPP